MHVSRRDRNRSTLYHRLFVRLEAASQEGKRPILRYMDGYFERYSPEIRKYAAKSRWVDHTAYAQALYLRIYYRKTPVCSAGPEFAAYFRKRRRFPYDR